MPENAVDRIASTIASPMAIVTTRASDQMNGCLVGFFTQCSIEPVRYLVCISKANRTYEIARTASALVVHMLHDEGHDRALAELFGEVTAYDADKLAACEWQDCGPHGVPVISHCDWFGGPIIDRVDLGDHVGFVLEVDAGDAARTAEPYLGFVDVRDLDAGNPA